MAASLPAAHVQEAGHDASAPQSSPQQLLGLPVRRVHSRLAVRKEPRGGQRLQRVLDERDEFRCDAHDALLATLEPGPAVGPADTGARSLPRRAGRFQGRQAPHRLHRDGAAMITAEMRAQMRRLVLVEGWRIETVARRFSVHHSVVRRALQDDAGERPKTPSGLEPFKPYIVERLTDLPDLTSTRLLQDLQQRSFPLGICQLRRYVAMVRAPRSCKAYLRLEVDPGEQAQVDWGSFGHIRIGAVGPPFAALHKNRAHRDCSAALRDDWFQTRPATFRSATMSCCRRSAFSATSSMRRRTRSAASPETNRRRSITCQVLHGPRADGLCSQDGPSTSHSCFRDTSVCRATTRAGQLAALDGVLLLSGHIRRVLVWTWSPCLHNIIHLGVGWPARPSFSRGTPNLASCLLCWRPRAAAKVASRSCTARPASAR